MSGTSLDGLDLCYTEFDENNRFEIIKAGTYEYSEEWKVRLKSSIYLGGEELIRLDKEYGALLGEKTMEFMRKNRLKNPDLIASHGHTVFHNPASGYTLQVGDGRAIFEETQIPVVYDFRSRDVIMGGQGAPLVPIGDELLFSEYDACLNLGGFSNISFKRENHRVAFDICPVNIVLNHLSEKVGKKYDENGEMARHGKIIPDLMQKLNNLEFYEKKPPKSLGLEWCIENVYPLLNTTHYEIPDLLTSFTVHAAMQISQIFNNYKIENVLITGGGAYNQFLIENISKHTKAKIIIPEKVIVEYKEALIFSLMGKLRREGKINILKSVTGANKDHSGGLIISE